MLWCIYMNRYQVYLNPQSVGIFDQVALDMGLSRSHIIRDWFDRIALEYEKILTVRSVSRLKDNPILKMSGIGKSNTPNLSEDVDNIYLHD